MTLVLGSTSVALVQGLVLVVLGWAFHEDGGTPREKPSWREEPGFRAKSEVVEEI